MWGGVPIFVAFAPSWCFSIEAVNHLCPSNKPKKLVSGLVLQESTTILQLKVYIVSVMKNKSDTHLGRLIGHRLIVQTNRTLLLIWLHSFSHFPGMQDLWIISFFFFFHEFKVGSCGKETIEVTLSIISSGSGQTCSKWFKTTRQIFFI